MRVPAQKAAAPPQVKSSEPSRQPSGSAERDNDADFRRSALSRSALGAASPPPAGNGPSGNGSSFSSSSITHDFGRIQLFPRAASSFRNRIDISSPHDRHEREAESRAERIMRMPDPVIRRQCACGGTCPDCKGRKGEEGEGLLQPKREGGNAAGEATVPAVVHDVLRAPGAPLAPSARSFLEPRFGRDFGHVRVHTDGRAAESARAIGARAYTLGRDIVFGRGEYDPGSAAGRRLLAHELEHVRQQEEGGIPRIDRFAACGPAADCPPREAGEERAARTDPMGVHGISDPSGILIANFAVGSGAIKPDLARNPDFLRIQSQMRANAGFRWEILGFSDCDGTESTNTSLRTARANALRAALPTDLHAQITGTAGAPIGDCMQSNATAEGRRFNRSAFLHQTVSEVTLPEVVVEAARPAPSHLYGVTSPASQYFVRTSPNGEIIGQLVLREMRVQVIGESGTNVDNLWLQVRFSRQDMDAIQAAYRQSMAARTGRLPDLQRRRTELQDYIRAMESRPGMRFEVQPEITRARERLAPIESDIRQIEAHQQRLVTPYTGLTAWVGAAALGVVAMHYDTFLNLVDAFDAAHSTEPLRDRLTRLRQFGEDASLEGDTVVGRGGNLPNRVTQSDRRNDPRNWELLLEAKQIRMPDGSFIDVHHFILGLDALALPASAQSSSRVLRSYLIASVDVGESWSATTWSGDVGGAVGDYVLHKSSAWEAANTSADNAQRLRFYFDTRAPQMDLLADIDAWGAFSAVPRTNTASTSFTSLRQIIEATYGPAGQTAGEYNTQIAPRRRQGVENFLCNYGFSGPTGLVSQTAARARVLDQVRIFATGWYDARASSSGVNTVFGRTGATDARILTASGEMTDMFLNWLERLASTVGLGSMTCNSLSSPLRRR